MQQGETSGEYDALMSEAIAQAKAAEAAGDADVRQFLTDVIAAVGGAEHPSGSAGVGAAGSARAWRLPTPVRFVNRPRPPCPARGCGAGGS